MESSSQFKILMIFLAALIGTPFLTSATTYISDTYINTSENVTAQLFCNTTGTCYTLEVLVSDNDTIANEGYTIPKENITGYSEGYTITKANITGYSEGYTITKGNITGYSEGYTAIPSANLSGVNATIIYDNLSDEQVSNTLTCSIWTGNQGYTIPKENITGYSEGYTLTKDNITGYSEGYTITKDNITGYSEGYTAIPSANLSGVNATIIYDNLSDEQVSNTLTCSIWTGNQGYTIPKENITGYSEGYTLTKSNITGYSEGYTLTKDNITGYSEGYTMIKGNITGYTEGYTMPAENVTAGTFPVGNFLVQGEINMTEQNLTSLNKICFKNGICFTVDGTNLLAG